jgi:hypothetical protein
MEAGSDGMIDLETAAMLMTDIHHKATGQSAGADDDDRSAPYSPDHTTMFDHATPYLSNAGALPQMPWDHFVPHAVNPARPLSSSPSGSQGSQSWQLSFAGAGSAAGHGHAHPLLDRYHAGADALAPALPSLNGSMPVSGSATPHDRGLSPFPFLLGPVSPVDYRRSPGPGQALTTPKAPQIGSDEELQTVARRVQAYGAAADALPPPPTLQSRSEANAFLSSYFTLFHPHWPFLHPESFRPLDASPPLLLAVLSVGALYTAHLEQACRLWTGSKMLVSEFVYNREEFSSRRCPLWAMQTTLLNMVFASWSGVPTGLEWTCSIRGLLANVSPTAAAPSPADASQVVAGNRYELRLRAEAREGAAPSHVEWIEDEGCRRTYYAVYVFFGMLTLTYNYAPAINFNEFEDLELPSSESLWNLEVGDDDAWRDHLAAAIVITAREAHVNLFQGEATRYSAFATRVMINALFLEVYAHQRQYEALQDVLTEYRLRLALDTWQASLDLCEPETVIVQLHAPHRGHPLIFNAMAMYRNTRARLLVDLKSIQDSLRYYNSYDVANQMLRARDLIKRSREMDRVIEQCVECVEIFAAEGLKTVGRACATNWSVEHPLCAFDLVAILSLWLYRLEHDDDEATEEEIAIYTKIKDMMAADDPDDPSVSTKQSATLARLWGEMLDDMNVWGYAAAASPAPWVRADVPQHHQDHGRHLPPARRSALGRRGRVRRLSPLEHPHAEPVRPGRARARDRDRGLLARPPCSRPRSPRISQLHRAAGSADAIFPLAARSDRPAPFPCRRGRTHLGPTPPSHTRRRGGMHLRRTVLAPPARAAPTSAAVDALLRRQRRHASSCVPRPSLSLAVSSPSPRSVRPGWGRDGRAAATVASPPADPPIGALRFPCAVGRLSVALPVLLETLLCSFPSFVWV